MSRYKGCLPTKGRDVGLLGSRARSNPHSKARYAGCSNFLAAISEFCKVLNLTITNSSKHLRAARVVDLRERPRTFVDYTVILGVPVLSGPSLNP